MKAIDNSGILNITNNCGCSGFEPAVNYSYNSGADTMTVTDASVFPAGDGLKIIHVNVTDTHGGDKYGKIEVAAGNVVIDTSGLNANGGFNIRATVVTNDDCDATMSAYGIASATADAGAMGNSN